MSAKAKRSMISEGILAQIGSIGAATDELAQQTQHEPKAAAGPGPKQKGRPAKKPPCTKITLDLPTDLLERLQELADERTGGNRTMLIERILSGRMVI